MNSILRGFCSALLAVVLLAPVARAEIFQRVRVSTTAGGGAIGIISNLIESRGFDRKHGVIIEFKKFNPAKAEDAVFFKTVDAGIFAPISAARAQLKGQPIQIFQPVMLNFFTILVPHNSPVKSLKDLQGKRLGLFARVTAMYSSFATITKMRGGDVEKDYKLTLGTPQALSAFLVRGDVDAIGMFEPRASLMVAAHQARELVSFNDLWKQETGKPLLAIGIAAYKDWIDHNLKAARGIAAAYADGVRALHADPAGVIEQQKNYIGIKTQAAFKRVTAVVPGFFVTGWTPTLIDSTKLLIRKNVEMKLLDRLPKEPYLRELK